jgi:hypothetical protein
VDTHLQNSKTHLRISKAPRSNSMPRIAVELGLAGLGIALAICAAAARQPWLDRHFLPSFVVGRAWYVRIETVVRAAMFVEGAILALVVRRRLAAAIAAAPTQAASVAMAAVLALGASELALRHVHVRSSEWLLPAEEPRRQPDALLGWTLVPARTGHLSIGGREIDYAIDASGYRVRRLDAPVDVSRPTILFAGESVIFGEGLTWDESIPAQVSAMTGVQSANLGVNGYSSDQAYLRLRQELPRFRRPVAVVSLFMPVLFGRNLDDDRPHLGPGMTWQPATPHARLASLLRLLVPYRSDAEVERGVLTTRDVLRATIDLARSRGAAAVIVVPQLGPEDGIDAALRRRVLEDGGLPYVGVELDASWHVPSDAHPDARGAHAIAAAIAARLRSMIPTRRM